MDKYVENLRKRMIYQVVGGIILIPAAIITFIVFLRSERIVSGGPIKDFIGGVFIGLRAPLIAGFIFYHLCLAYRKYKALKSETEIKKLYVEEHDERLAMINSKASKTSTTIVLYIIMVLVIVFGFINQIVSVTLLLVWALIAALNIVVHNYYESKF